MPSRGASNAVRGVGSAITRLATIFHLSSNVSFTALSDLDRIVCANRVPRLFLLSPVFAASAIDDGDGHLKDAMIYTGRLSSRKLQYGYETHVGPAAVLPDASFSSAGRD